MHYLKKLNNRWGKTKNRDLNMYIYLVRADLLPPVHPPALLYGDDDNLLAPHGDKSITPNIRRLGGT